MNKAKEKLLNETYDRLIQTSLNVRPLEKIDEFIDPNVMGYGTTIDEKITSIAGYRDLIEKQAEQSKNMEMTFEQKPVFKRILDDGNAAIIVEELELLFLIGSEKMSLQLRFSSVWEYRQDNWILVHWHGSKPEYDEGGSDTWHIEEHQAKTARLEKEVAEKTANLLKKNRELEIETALEKVRSTALAMKEPEDMLEVCRVISDQLQALDVQNIRNVQTAIINASKGTYFNYQYFTAYDKKVFEDSVYGQYPKALELAETMQKSTDAFFGGSMQGDELETFREWRNRTNQFPDPLLDETSAVYYNFYSIGQGGLGLTTYSELPPENLEVFKRFHKVFTLAYRRFLDIEKAEFQAREAQIELALEKVRAKAMGMHNSAEVGAVSDILFAELNKLNLDIIGCSIVVIDEPEDKMELWRARSNVAVKPFDSTSLAKAKHILKTYLPDFFPKFLNAVGTRKGTLIEEFSGKRRLQFFKAVIEQYNYSKSETSAIIKNTPESITTHFIFFKLGYLVLLTEKMLSDADLSVVGRFIEVFSFAYSRFLDIKNAEAQAKEAQIEAALERVRAKTMAMQKSDELAETAEVLFQQFSNLGENPDQLTIGIMNEEEKVLEVWLSIQGNRINKVFKSSIEEPIVINKIYKAWKDKKQNIEIDISGEELEKYNQYRNSLPEFKEYNRIKKSKSKEKKRRIIYGAYFKSGLLSMATPDPRPSETIHLLKRFADVFDLTYTRFLDLQKAEAQAREAQIETTLERVRSRTMAMQKSNELAQTAANLFEQIETLGIKPYRCNIAIVDDKNKKIKLWSTTNSGNVIPVGSDIPLNENSVFKEMHMGWKKQKKNHTIKLIGEDRVKWTKYISKYVPFEEYKPKNFNKSKLMKEAAFFNNCYFRQGFFVIHTKEEISEEDYNIVQRFANVFEQTYTRFRDLENAEYQNKIIQAENERKTEELEEARQLQLSMLPKEIPQLPHLEIAVYMQTATEVGGDYYDFSMQDDGSLNVALGDATGHGLKAGIMVSAMKSIFTTNSAKMDMSSFFATANSGVKSMGLKRMMMGLTMLNIHNHAFQLINAGMPPVFLFRSKSAKVEEITEHGLPIGAMSLSKYTLTEGRLHQGDVLLLLTDGMPELQNEARDMFGYERIKTELRAVGRLSPEKIIDHLKNRAKSWTGGHLPEDDVTFVVLRVK